VQSPRALYAIPLLFLILSSLSAQSTAPNPRQWEWRFVAGGATVGPGAFSDDGTFYFASDDRYVYALDRNGTMIWRTDLGRRPAGGVVVGVDESILVTLENGEIIVGGFDITDTAIEYIERDAMQYLVGQNTYMQGFMPTILAYMYIMEDKLPPQIINTGAPVITIDNLEDAETSS